MGVVWIDMSEALNPESAAAVGVEIKRLSGYVAERKPQPGARAPAARLVLRE